MESCNLNVFIFEETNLVQAKFNIVLNFKIEPDQNQLKKAKFLKEGVVRLPGKYDIVVVRLTPNIYGSSRFLYRTWNISKKKSVLNAGKKLKAG